MAEKDVMMEPLDDDALEDVAGGAEQPSCGDGCGDGGCKADDKLQAV